MFDGQHLFLNMATCHSYTRVKTFNYDAMINNTCTFHFVPGCEGKKFSEKLRCKEDSEVTKNIINKALEQPDPIKLGIVLHAYAENRWLKEAFANFDDEKFHQRTVKDVELAPDFPNSNWYKYYLAVEWYKDDFFNNCSKLGLDIPR